MCWFGWRCGCCCSCCIFFSKIMKRRVNFIKAMENQEIETYFGKCCCCLQYGYLRSMWDQHFVEDEEEIYGQMLINCFSIPWTSRKKEDQICENCIWKLREAFKFKLQVLKNQNLALEPGTSASNIIEEIKSEPEEDYQVEYLDEEILDKNEGSKDIKTSPSPLNGDAEPDFLDDDDDDGDYDEKLELKHVGDTDSETDSPMRVRKRRSIVTGSDADTPKQKPKKLPKDERSQTYRQYAEEELRTAVDAVMRRTLNQKQAAKKYRIPIKTLSAKIRALRDQESNPDGKPTDKPSVTPAQRSIVLNKHKDNLYSVLAHSNATPIGGHCGKYACCYCPALYVKPHELKAHTREQHKPETYKVQHVRAHYVKLDITALTCTICDGSIPELDIFMRHIKFKHGKAMHFDIQSHLVPFRFDGDEMKCTKCGRDFGNFKNLAEHMNDVHYRNYECYKCLRGFVNERALTTHALTHKLAEFPCEICSKSFGTRLRRTNHIRRKHVMNGKVRKCGYCDERFVHVSSKINHEIEVHDAPKGQYHCGACAKSFDKPRNLKRHQEFVHLLSRNYACTKDGCDKKFFNRKELISHEGSHVSQRLFPCKVCPKTFKGRTGLFRHMHTHNEKRTHGCAMCAKRYTTEENLELHVQSAHNLQCGKCCG